MNRAVTLALTGASGAAYGVGLLQALLAAGCSVYLLRSAAAQVVISTELGESWPDDEAACEHYLSQRFGAAPGQLSVCRKLDWFAPVASGSAAPKQMVIAPCSMGTLSAIAHGASDNLIERAADVVLKERRSLILVPRETPFSVIHLENMLRLARAGAVIVPPSPGFYEHPQSVADLVDFVVARILDQLRVPHTLGKRWGGAV